MAESQHGWTIRVQLSPPHLQDNTADTDRLINRLKHILSTSRVDVDLSLSRELPDILRAWSYDVRCILFKDRDRWLLNGVMAADNPSPAAGLAVDLGTTRVVTRLVNLATGQSLAEFALDNPQIAIGPDVLTRIHYADQKDGVDHLHRLIVEGLNTAVEALCRQAGIERECIFLVSVAGNTAMGHLFLNLNPHWMIREPYIPVVNTPQPVRARDLGLRVSPHAHVLVFPNIGSYFGGDLIAGLLYSGLYRKEETAILVDVGTNAEVVVGNAHWLMACAGAAGPALEGGAARMGMTAGPGVIDHVDLDPETGNFKIHTIENLPPRGICGSGLIDLAARLFSAGLVDFRGKLKSASHDPRIREIDGIRHLVLIPESGSGTGRDLTIGQTDIDSLIRSKAAMYTILETLLTTVGLSFDDLDVFYVAGTFGSFIRPESAITIGMLPDLPRERFKVLGNSSLEGASLLLSDPASADGIHILRDRITYLEMNVNQEFMNRFSAAKFLPHTDPARFPSVKI